MKGVVTIDPLYASPKRQKRFAERLEQYGYKCELRVRFDRLHIVAFEKDLASADPAEEIYRLLREDASWHEQDCHIKILG